MTWLFGIILSWLVGNPLIIRFLEGDFIWFFLGGYSALLGYFAACLIKNKYLRIGVGILFASAGIVFAHWVYEFFMTLYTTPLGPHL